MDRARDLSPSINLLCRPDARRHRIAFRLFGNIRSFGDDKPRRCALQVVAHGQLADHSGCISTVASHRGHDHPIL